MTNRREFIIAASALAATPAFGQAKGDTKSNQPICVFTKPFNSLSFDELADRMAELGVNGIEAPIRSHGHVEPKEVEDRLPELVEALAKRNLEVTVMASDINDPDDPDTARVLRTAATLGIKRYRMKYFKYDLSKSVLDQIEDWKPQLRDLAAMNHDFGIRGLYQNHAGRDYMGASLWDLKHALDGIDPGDIGIAYDIRHATAEGGMSWQATLNAVFASIDTVYVKDFQWGPEKLVNVPLGDGRIQPKFFDLLRQADFNGPISLHEEYLDHRPPELVPQHLDAIEKDLAVLHKWLHRD